MQGGSEQDGKDVFEEAFLVFERQVLTGHFRGESSQETRFHGITRWQWLALRRKSRPTLDVETISLLSVEQTPEKILISAERRVILQQLLAQVGERCQKLLGLFQLNHSMHEIREMLGYASDQVAANDPFGSMYKTTCARFEQMNVPPFPMTGLLVFWGGLQNGFWAFSHNPQEYAPSVKFPTLLLYGEKDTEVSRQETDNIFKNLNGKKRLATFAEAGHENYLKRYEKEWIKEVSAFLHDNRPDDK